MSKFKGLRDWTKGVDPEPEQPAPPSPAPPEAAEKRGPGRPKGKRSDPTFDQVTAYIPHGLYRDVRLELLKADQGQEFSQLVAELLSAWLADRKSG